MTLPRKITYRSDLFHPNNLTSTNAIQDALLEFEGVINQSTFETILLDLLDTDKSHIVELVLSCMPSESTPLATWILERFPLSVHEYISSMTPKLLSKLSVFFLFAPLPNREGLGMMAAHHRFVTGSLEILQILSAATFVDDETLPVESQDNVGAPKSTAKVKAKSQKKLKQAKRAVAKALFDSKPFEALNLSVPDNRREADEIVSEVLTILKSILELYLDTIRSPDVVDAIRDSFFLKDDLSIPQPKDVVKDVPLDSDEPVTAEVSSAYPLVQPMKSALYFDSAEGFGDWKILISTRADGNLRDARRRDRKTFYIIVKKIKELSNGHFSDDNQKRLNGHNTDIPIYEAKMTRDSRLVYQIDCIPEYDSQREHQVIKVFGIYTHAQLGTNSRWDSLGRQLSSKGAEYRHRCTFRKRPPHTGGDKVFVPETFPPLLEIDTSIKDTIPNLPPDDLEHIHSLLVLEKFVTMSKALLHSILADLDVAFPFHVSAQEKGIIEHPDSCYVLGRSGTGKTTTMLFKMLFVERTFHLNRDNLAKPRQMFVTQSRVLAGKVEEYFLKLLDSLSTSVQSPEELKILAKSRKGQQQEDSLVDIDDELNWRSDLPSRFSLLGDEHFPLFITFDRLCTLIEADIVHDHASFSSGPVSTSLDVKKTGNFITYDVFLAQYWPHFAQFLTKGMDPLLVFSELLGVIMGSEGTTAGMKGYLDQHSYENLSERTQSAFANQRGTIYSIFQSYQGKKTQRGDFDAADRTHRILRHIDRYGVSGQKIDHLYVDEAQDNLLVDTLLLRSICLNPNGLFWAGDTAQTIAVGSSFRFDDLKAFLFRIEKQRQADVSLKKSSYESREPKTFQLSVNYRSHAGIVNCAHSVIELITHFWPYSIDKLAREKGIVDGLKPVFFYGWTSNNASYSQFLFGASGSHVEFGAQQCILVRDDAVREKLRDEVGDIGLIMTLYESKGLEFNDVLLYDFFENSIADLAQWRVVLNAIEGKPVPAPQFDEVRHAGICNELKFLYVAITRARKNMWIADCSEKGEPMRMFWQNRNQITSCTPDTGIPQLAVSSTPDEWAAQGKAMFDRKRYAQAKHCYEKAGRPREAAVSHAYILRDQARKALVGESKKMQMARRAAFIRAAKAFVSCAQDASKNKLQYYSIAADCYEHADDHLTAAQTYLIAEDYTMATKLFRKAGKFDEAVTVMKENESKIPSDVVENITDVARLFYFNEQKLKQAHELFTSYEEELVYLEDRGLDIARATILASIGRTFDAAELLITEGKNLEAITMFLRGKSDEQSMRRAKECILEGLWRNLPFRFSSHSNESQRTVSELLRLSRSLDDSLVDGNDHLEIDMFAKIASGAHREEFSTMGDAFLQARNFPAALLCFDHYFSAPLTLHNLDVHQLTNTLRLFLDYVRILYDLAFNLDPCSVPWVAKVLGFRQHGENEFTIPTRTLIHSNLPGAKRTVPPATEQEEHQDLSIQGGELRLLVRRIISNLLERQVHDENESCSRARAISPCLNFAVFGNCQRVECPQEHLEASALDSGVYNTRIRIHIQQILIVQNIHSIETSSLFKGRRRYWIERLYEALSPSSYHLGTPSSLNFTLIPEAVRGMQVVKDWIRSTLYDLDFRSIPSAQFYFLTGLLRAAQLSFAFDRNEAAGYIYRCEYLYHTRSEYLRDPNGNSILPELLNALEGNQTWSTSAGILSIRHIIVNSLPVNIGVLCDYLEHLCGSFILVNRFQFAHNLHDITLPRSWLLKYTGTNPPLVYAPMTTGLSLLHLLVEAIKPLLEAIYVGGESADHLLYENLTLKKINYMTRNIFIARICRCIGLLGYNVKNDPLRNSILKAITSLRREHHSFSSTYSRYVYSESWRDVSMAVRRSTGGSRMDELVQVLHSSRTFGQPSKASLIQSIIYTSIEEIPLCLSSEEIVLPPSRSTKLPTVDIKTVSSNQDSNTLEHEDLIMDEIADEIDDTPEFQAPDADEDDAALQSADMRRLQEFASLSDVELQAASVIGDAYKAVLLRRRNRNRTPATGLAATRSHFFTICLQEAQTMEKGKGYYRLRFLGPLPHLLLCLDAAHKAATAQKIEAKKRLLQKNHEDLDELSLRLTNLSSSLKAIITLQKDLGPKADVHRRRNVDELVAYVQKAADLILNLPFDTPEDLQDDLARAVKGIVTPPVDPAVLKLRMKQKPNLAMDDDDMYI